MISIVWKSKADRFESDWVTTRKILGLYPANLMRSDGARSIIARETGIGRQSERKAIVENLLQQSQSLQPIA